jgi:hypothetical protein
LPQEAQPAFQAEAAEPYWLTHSQQGEARRRDYAKKPVVLSSTGSVNLGVGEDKEVKGMWIGHHHPGLQASDTQVLWDGSDLTGSETSRIHSLSQQGNIWRVIIFSCVR